MERRLRELISEAMRTRLSEVLGCRIAGLLPEESGEHTGFIKELQANVKTKGKQSVALFQHAIDDSDWLAWEGDCLEALCHLSQGGSLRVLTASRPASENFLSLLREQRQKPDQLFRLLRERYSCPLNIARAVEWEAREYLLETLMVRDRARIERGTGGQAAFDEVFLKLNLLAIHASVSSDLRYMDALNYYYEILPERFGHKGEATLLYLSFLGLYAQALSTWMDCKLSE